MANQIVKTLLSDGPSKAILSVFLRSDGIEGELDNYVLLDPLEDLTPPADKLAILQIWYSFSWFDGFLSFDDLVDFPSWNLTRDTDGYFDFRYFGGITDRSGIDHTGKLLLSTTDFAPLDAVGSLVIELGKK